MTGDALRATILSLRIIPNPERPLLAQLQVPGNTYGAFGLASAILLFNPPMAGTAVQCATLAGGLSYCYAPCFWEDVTSFNIVSGANMAAGTRAVLTGMKK